jgi:hypothetical protein
MSKGFISANNWNETLKEKFDGDRPPLSVDDEDLGMSMGEEIWIEMDIEEITVDEL